MAHLNIIQVLQLEGILVQQQGVDVFHGRWDAVLNLKPHTYTIHRYSPIWIVYELCITIKIKAPSLPYFQTAGAKKNTTKASCDLPFLYICNCHLLAFIMLFNFSPFILPSAVKLQAR